MNDSQIAVIRECVRGAHDATLKFPAIVAKLMQAGIESYHVDYYRGETTYYAPDGASHVEPVGLPSAPVAPAFSAPAVVAAIRGSQQGAITYPEFVRLTREAGCTGYVACLAGRRVIYSGRTGDSHTEHFPS